MNRLHYIGGDTVSIPGGPTLPGHGGLVEVDAGGLAAIARNPVGASLIRSGALSGDVEWPALYEPSATQEPPARSAKKRSAKK